jgi:hypothetical protein
MKAVTQGAEKKRETKIKVLAQKVKNGKCEKAFKGTTDREEVKREKCKQSVCFVKFHALTSEHITDSTSKTNCDNISIEFALTKM